MFNIRPIPLPVDVSERYEVSRSFVRMAAEPPPFVNFRTNSLNQSVSSSSDSSNLQREPEATPVTSSSSVETASAGSSPTSDSSNGMDEFYQIRRELLITTLILAGLVFGPIWWVYSLNIALNYLFGALTGIIYLGLLARNVERLGPQNQKMGKSQLAIFILAIVLASRWEYLAILPVFLGFLTYKAAVLIYMLRTLVRPQT